MRGRRRVRRQDLGLRRHPRLLLVGAVLYLALIFGVMLWRGIEIEPQWVVLALLVIALAMGRGRQFVVDWTPFLLLFFAYEVMRGFAAKTGFPVHDVSPLERLLFAGAIPTIWLQQHIYDPSRISPWDWAGMVLYFLHFVVPVVVGFVFWMRDRDHYRRYVAALIGMSFAAFITYLFWPSAPPWHEFPKQVVKINDQTIAKWGVDYYVSPVYSRLNPNRFAAFPSLHAAFPALAAVYAWQRYRVIALALVLWAAAVWLAIVYLGEHYFVDALAGLAYALVASLAVEYMARRGRAQVPVEARAPMPPTRAS